MWYEQLLAGLWEGSIAWYVLATYVLGGRESPSITGALAQSSSWYNAGFLWGFGTYLGVMNWICDCVGNLLGIVQTYTITTRRPRL